MDRWRQQAGVTDERIGIGIDRIDYTKGIPERLRALDLFLEQNPAYREHFVFVQIGVPSRIQVKAYKLLDDEIDGLVEEINWKWSTESWQPIQYFKKSFAQPEMMALHRLADFCVVSSLHDGMNLVAKEFVASRFDDDGVLILSKFHGSGPRVEGCHSGQPVFRRGDGRAPCARRWRCRKRNAASTCSACAPRWPAITSSAGPAKSSRPCSNSISPRKCACDPEVLVHANGRS